MPAKKSVNESAKTGSRANGHVESFNDQRSASAGGGVRYDLQPQRPRDANEVDVTDDPDSNDLRYEARYRAGEYAHVAWEESAEEAEEREQMEYSYGNFSARGPLPEAIPPEVLPEDEYEWLARNHPDVATNYYPVPVPTAAPAFSCLPGHVSPSDRPTTEQPAAQADGGSGGGRATSPATPRRRPWWRFW